MKQKESTIRPCHPKQPDPPSQIFQFPFDIRHALLSALPLGFSSSFLHNSHRFDVSFHFLLSHITLLLLSLKQSPFVGAAPLLHFSFHQAPVTPLHGLYSIALSILIPLLMMTTPAESIADRNSTYRFGLNWNRVYPRLKLSSYLFTSRMRCI